MYMEKCVHKAVCYTTFRQNQDVKEENTTDKLSDSTRHFRVSYHSITTQVRELKNTNPAAGHNPLPNIKICLPKTHLNGCLPFPVPLFQEKVLCLFCV